jgi:hypothetical protein
VELSLVLGWVSYALSALLASVSNAKLMPSALEVSSIVITTKNGYSRPNNSWVLSRILRDYESWMDIAVRLKLNSIMDDRHNYLKSHTKPGTPVPRPQKSGLCIAVYEPSRRSRAGEPRHDLVYWSGFPIILSQIAVAIVPLLSASRDWSVMVITVVGTILSFLVGALSQWQREKWFCRRNAMNTYALTRGNGSQHALIILGNGHGLDLEDLAAGIETLETAAAGWKTKTFLFIMGWSWILLLIAAAGLSQPSWYLLAVGGIGMMHNLFVAGWPRHPSAMGIHLKFRTVIGHMSTMEALLALEAQYTHAGRSLLPIYFPGRIFPEEEAQWEALRLKAEHEESVQRQNIQAGRARPPMLPLESWILHAKSYEGKRK